ncbi:hypothetical protein [Qipengyuania vesicularis]|uniref:hypothetical protein n=1 Tax=Qipengyuania vesicularis TaxID=2867232 RepID=UPI001C872385|nr:hypothetical protein [Qipengyuania vesicularis]MBX7526974.1 hypothetical protein [Qipengyuania vesicularis]
MEISTRREKLRKRLSDYWRLEIGNAFLVPATAVFVAYTSESSIGWLTILTFLPMCALLVLGGLYWRGKLLALDGNDEALHAALRIADRFDGILCVTSFLALGAALASWVFPQMSVSLGDRIAATVCGLLAALEYVNYYHRQLQHFDNAADFKRLISGKGFRKSQMAADLERFRSTP